MLNDTATITVDIDVSKSHLGAYERLSGRSERFTNTPLSFRKLAKWIDPQVYRVVYEPTSRHRRPLTPIRVDGDHQNHARCRG